MSINIKRKHAKPLAAAALIGLFVLLLFGTNLLPPTSGQVTGDLGLRLQINYTDETQRSIVSQNFAGLISLSGVYEAGKPITSIGIFVLAKTNIATFGSFTCEVEIKWANTLQDTIAITQAFNGQANEVVSYVVRSIDADTFLSWSVTNASFTYMLDVTAKNTGKVSMPNGDVVYFNGQTLMLELVSDTTITGTSPPVNPPPVAPTVGALKVQGTYNSVAVAFEAWYTNGTNTSPHVQAPAAGYTWQDLVPGSYIAQGAYQSNTVTSTVTVTAGQTVTATINFGGPQAPTYIFQDGFEGAWPSTAWTTYVTPGTTITKSSSSKVGIYSLAHSTNGTVATWDAARTTHDLGQAYTSAYYRCYAYFSALPTILNGYYNPFNIRALTANPGALAWFEVRNTASGVVFVCSWRDAATASTKTVVTTKTVQTSFWHTLQIFISVGAPGTVTFWVDGTQVHTVSVTNNEWAGARYVVVGEHYASAGSGVHVTYIDDVIVDDVYIS